MLGAIAQFETEIRAERQMDGIKNAKARGVRLGRRQTLTSEQVGTPQTARKQETLIPTLMRDFNVSKSTVYRYLGGVTPDHANPAG